MREAATAFAQHTFFCFNASADAGTVIPITSHSSAGPEGKPTSFMLLFTCEMVLEHARPFMDSLGAFQGRKDIAATAVPAASVLTSLQTPGQGNAGVHINEFVPGLALGYKALGLSTAGLVKLFELGGCGGSLV